jgi:hypothetical protein
LAVFSGEKYCQRHNDGGVPVSLFASVMGIAGLSVAFQRFAAAFAPAHAAGVALLAAAYLETSGKAPC